VVQPLFLNKQVFKQKNIKPKLKPDLNAHSQNNSEINFGGDAGKMKSKISDKKAEAKFSE